MSTQVVDVYRPYWFLSTFLLIDEQGVLMFPAVIVDLFLHPVMTVFVYFVFI